MFVNPESVIAGAHRPAQFPVLYITLLILQLQSLTKQSVSPPYMVDDVASQDV